jgi:ribA/ribD-fused uncharacterized protein
MRVTDKYILFWGGPLSQWYDSPFTYENLNGRVLNFKTAEHFMMYHKALVFNDKDIAEKILTSNHPKEAKELGRKVKNFDPQTWESKCLDIVTLGNYLKFNSDNYLNNYILNRKWKDLSFVEASPHDKIWGIGLHYNDSKCDDIINWDGKNYLGLCLDRTRKIMLGKGLLNEMSIINNNIDALHF